MKSYISCSCYRVHIITSVASKSLSLASSTPTTWCKSTGPATALLTRNILSRPEAGTISLVSKGTSICSEKALDWRRRLDPVPPSLECRIQSCHEIVEMSGNDTCALLHSALRSTHDQGESKHSPRQILDWNLQDDEVGFLSSVVLCEGVDECKEERCGEDVGIKQKSCRCLVRVSVVARVEGANTRR